MKIVCRDCGRDINAIGQDNMSSELGRPLCEDCFYDIDEEDREFDVMSKKMALKDHYYDAYKEDLYMGVIK